MAHICNRLIAYDFCYIASLQCYLSSWFVHILSSPVVVIVSWSSWVVVKLILFTRHGCLLDHLIRILAQIHGRSIKRIPTLIAELFLIKSIFIILAVLLCRNEKWRRSLQHWSSVILVRDLISIPGTSYCYHSANVAL